MKVIFYDVEHGSCCHIITPNNKHILVDIGSKTDSSIVEYINRKYYGGRGGQVDQLIITHPHEDHIYDLPNLCSTLSPKALQRPKEAFDIIPTKNTLIHRTIAECANKMNRAYNIPIAADFDPTNEAVNGGVHFDVIFPKGDWTTKDDLNTFSCVVIVTYSGYKFVLTGDNPASVLQKMIDADYCDIVSKIEDADVLLAPHHGRVNEFCRDFFDRVNPYLTVVSDKSIEHGTQMGTAKLYKGRGVELWGQERYVLTTRNDGTIIFDVESDHCTISIDKENY